VKLFTIGFTKSTAEHFFRRIKSSDATKIVDVRLNNVSQLAGFAKRDDLKYFARELCGAGYQHMPDLAPTKAMLDAYKKQKGDWSSYEREFLGLMSLRHIERMERPLVDAACLLCSEDKPHHCHRRLVAEYLQHHWGDVEIIHL
jgi:uncharacterized protein (DUF488 family)